MKIFKNEVGRPSKEKVVTRRMYMVTFVVSCFAIVLSIIAILNSNFNFIKLSGAAANTCKFPYTYKKCSGKANDTVKKVQELLKTKICTSNEKKVACYSDKTDGKFGSKTKTAVTNFQKTQKIEADGNVGYETLTTLAKKTKTRYFVIEYDKGGSSTALSGTQTLTSKSKKKYVQAFIYGVTEKISDTKLKKSGYEHVGYTIESIYNGITYRYGCFDKNCKTGNWYDSETIQKNKEAGKEFYSNVYSIGTKVSKTGQIGDGQVIKFTAKYCKSGEEYDKTKSSCVKKKATTTKAASGKSGNVSIVRNDTSAKQFNNNKSYPYSKKTGRNWEDFTKKMSGYLTYVAGASEKYDVDPAVIMGIIMLESGGKSNLANSSGCYGLMQIMAKYSKYSGTQLKDPKTNIYEGTKIYSEKYKKWKNETKALCGYNQGNNPTSTCSYASKVKEFKNIVKKLYNIKY